MSAKKVPPPDTSGLSRRFTMATDATGAIVATRHPGAVPVEDVAPNPLNRRTIDPGSADIAELAQDLRIRGQLQACPVVTRAAFIAIFPEHEPTIGSADYVQIAGGRRRAALIVAELTAVGIAVRDDLAATRLDFVSATWAENEARLRLDPVAEALAVQDAVREAGKGGQKLAAEKLGKTPPWVTQRLNLLRLLPQLQDLVSSGQMPIRVGREIGALPQDEQIAEWHRRSGGQLTAVNSPAQPDPGAGDDPPQEVAAPALPPKPRIPATLRAINRLGDTPEKVAGVFATHYQRDQIKELIQALSRLL